MSKMNDPMREEITIGFECIDTLGCHHKAESTVPICRDLGDNELETIGRQLNAFLKQVGYYRKNDCIFMEDITEDEYDQLETFLKDMRSRGDE